MGTLSSVPHTIFTYIPVFHVLALQLKYPWKKIAGTTPQDIQVDPSTIKQY
jgi:hypothetical protein